MRIVIFSKSVIVLVMSQIDFSSEFHLVVAIWGPMIFEIPLGNPNQGLEREKRNLRKEVPGER